MMHCSTTSAPTGADTSGPLYLWCKGQFPTTPQEWLHCCCICDLHRRSGTVVTDPSRHCPSCQCGTGAMVALPQPGRINLCMACTAVKAGHACWEQAPRQQPCCRQQHSPSNNQTCMRSATASRWHQWSDSPCPSSNRRQPCTLEDSIHHHQSY